MSMISSPFMRAGRTKRFFFWSFLLVACGLPLQGFAQSYPVRPVTIVVGFAAGGGADVVSRLLAEGLSPILSVPVIVENRPGAGGTIGGEYVARSTPDGYTLLVGGLGPNATAHSLYPSIKYDTLKDFAHITLISENANALALHPSVPAKTIGELVALARARPGAISFGSAGNGSAQHMAGELFKRQTRTDLLHVPFKGVAAGVNDLLAGRIEMMFIPASDAARFSETGKLRVLGVTTRTRSPALPKTPPMAEAGLPGYEQTVWNALLAPARTPDKILETLYAATIKTVGSPALRTRFEGLGYTPRTTAPGELSGYLKSEIAKYRTLIQEAGIRLD